jgi:hypothetical protein
MEGWKAVNPSEFGLNVRESNERVSGSALSPGVSWADVAGESFSKKSSRISPLRYSVQRLFLVTVRG